MKRLFAVFCLNLGLIGDVTGQSWSVVADYRPEVLRDVAFANASVGIAVGNQGLVFRTVNGGTSWSFHDLGTTEMLRSAYFADANRGFILGSSIYHTTNAGASWVKSAGPGEPMEGMYFVDNQRGTIVGANGSIYRTTNGGSDWTTQVSNVTNRLRSVWFTSEDNGIIVGEAGIILRTTNGGSSWTRHLSGTLQDLNSISFLNNTIGFISGGNGTILRTTDGGLNWLPAVVESSIVSLLKIRMLDASNGFAFGNSGNFNIPVDFLRTSDGGLTWSRGSYGTTRAVQFFGMSVVDPKRVVIVGNSGTVLRTSDGGSTWSNQELLPQPDLFGVTAPFSGVLSGALNVAGSEGFSFESSGGVAWGMNRLISQTLRAVHGAGVSLSAHTSIMVGDQGTVVVSHVNQSIGSRTSTRLNEDLTFNGVHMVDRDTAYIVADSGYIYKSTNRGSTWTQGSSGALVRLNAIDFADAMNGFAVGEVGRIRRTTNFGRSWIGSSVVTSARLNAICFASPAIGVIVGDRGTILHTSNGGNNWLLKTSPVGAELRSVSFVNSARGLAVGDSGKIIGTNDGGLTWQVQPSPVLTTLRGIAFLNETTAVAVGDQRTIVRTTMGVTSVSELVSGQVPSGYGLGQNYPNPFNPKTVLGSWLPVAGHVKLVVYDLLGREVAVMVNERREAGRYQDTFDAGGLASGVYICRMTAGSFSQSRKLTLMK